MAPATDPRAARPLEPEKPRLGVYVHFPWCLAKCPYCDFLSVAADRPAIPHEPYADAVVAELDRRAGELGAHRLASVFFGGGTPSLWKPAALGRVLRRILSTLGATTTRTGAAPGEPAPPPEITVECNPSSFDLDVGRALVDQGVNRVSLGIQGLDASRLRFLGRLHDAEGGLRAVRAALEAGVPRVSADFIFGVAGQSASDAAREVTVLADLGTTHLSAYALTIEHGTQFGALARKGRLPLLPEDAVADSFLAVHEALTARGFEHYEVSNYARSGHRAEHNLGYWRGASYLGLGCGAFGTVPLGGRRVRYRNTPVPERYTASAPLWSGAELDRASPGGLVSEVETLTAEALFTERLLLGLRLSEGLDLEAAGRELGVEPFPPGRTAAIERLVERGRLVREGSRLRIPAEAWLLADGTIAALA
jgi:oxygen-independent coproporphyrinogen-3 oxidase